MAVVYDLIFFLFALVYLPYFLLRGKWYSGFGTRFGSLPSGFKQRVTATKNIWIHAVSVGEVLTVAELVVKIRAAFPEYTLILSTVTPTGYALAHSRLKETCEIIYAPLDFSWVVRAYARAIRPRLYISAETEIWPNLFTCLHRWGVPIVQVNGRISDRAFQGYRKVAFLLKNVLSSVSMFCMQSPLDAERIVRLGASGARVRVVGNIKFDSLALENFARKEDFGFDRNEPIWIAGSTHPGEDEIVLDTYAALKKDIPALRLVIAPRHVERADDLMALIRARGVTAVKFSEAGGKGPSGAVVVDRIGHLRDLYSVADLVFIGKTFRVGGGQNVIEPLYFGKPTFVGPHTQNFKDVVRIFLEAGALIQVKSQNELAAAMREVWQDPQRQAAIRTAAQETIRAHQGATAKTLEVITDLLRE